ncbi:AraC family transcriptional regulator [Dyadobacter sp. NIV53]|uniref:helix-turn-helix domain-containing protein n=1 Tax=Dyadobacter sp. NIV53 TaxID=2861765 RepID=UPI001C87B681|nr:AraC family transcriptional regulator [Dyadobacter sp. NIV53]
MTENQNYIRQSEIFFSCTEKEYQVKEHFSGEHVLTHVYSGKLVVAGIDITYIIEEGNTVLFSKNTLAKITKIPGVSTAFKSISIFFTQTFLQDFYTTHPVPDKLPNVLKVRSMERHPLLDSLFNSVLPYYELSETLPEELTEMKMREAMSIIRKIDKTAENIISDFAEPGKIDLAGFMQKNFSYNISNDQFAFLTGRSLAAYKRDFQNIFNTSPQKWLLQKRLEQAHFLLAEKKQKTSDVYLEVGFENLSHFSYAFKQWFGYPPSSLSVSLSPNPV